MVIASWGGVSGLDRLSCLDKLEPEGNLQHNSGRTMNTKSLENFITSLTKVELRILISNEAPMAD
jgi:hypothetical protein